MNLQKAVDETPCKHTFIMGDFNAKVGKNNGERCMGIYGVGSRNERGDRLINFAESNNLFIMNTFYNFPEEEKWTWSAPNDAARNEIDFILTNCPKIIATTSVVINIDIGSDHRAVGAKFNEKFSTRKAKKKRKLPKISRTSLCNAGYEQAVLNYTSHYPNDIDMPSLINILNHALNDIQVIHTEQNCRNLPNDIKRLMEKRSRMKKAMGNKIEYTKICKIIRKQITL